MREVAIVGTGAMGSVYAGLLGRAGHEVWAIDVWHEHVDAIARDGLAVSGASGTYVVPGFDSGYKPGDAGACDLWVIGTKAADVEHVAADIAPLLRPGDVVLAFAERPRLGAVPATSPRAVWSDRLGFGSSIPSPVSVHHHAMRRSASAMQGAFRPFGDRRGGRRGVHRRVLDMTEGGRVLCTGSHAPTAALA